jgi:RimJ/RimL family protein N-acetyltransferase
LRRWRSEDFRPFAAMNADPIVMEYYPSTLSGVESATLVERIEAGFDIHGFGLWAVEVPGEAAFIGYIGLSPVNLDVPFAPAVEVGWRLARPFWGRGLATEGASTAIAFAFGELSFAQVVSFTSVGNVRSRKLMARVGMQRDPREDFDHPMLPEGDPLRLHVLYRLDRGSWRNFGPNRGPGTA